MLFSSTWFSLRIWLLAWQTTLQHSGEVKSLTDGLFPGDSANIANGLAPGSPRHSLSMRFSSILPLASFHLTKGAAVYLCREVTARLCIILGPGLFLHIPFGLPSSRSTEPLLIVTGPTVHRTTASQLPVLFSSAGSQWVQPSHSFTNVWQKIQ